MRLLANLFAAVALMFAPLSHAGDASSTTDGTTVLPALQIANFSKKVEHTLAQHGARVAILGRTGRPLEDLPPGVRYTHVAFAVYSMIEMAGGKQQPGYAIYNLYQLTESPNKSKLTQDYPFDFFAVVPELRAGIVIPVPKLQQRLLELITSESYQNLHNPLYSLMANPYNNQTQNCTEFVLNAIQASIYQTDNIDFIKRSIADHFTAYRVRVNPLKLVAGAVLLEGISLEDHSGPVRTATFTSIASYLQQFDLVQQVIELDGLGSM